MAEVERGTQRHRFARASAHDRRARQWATLRASLRGGRITARSVADRLGLVLDPAADELAQVLDALERRTAWHRQRAFGQRARFDRVRECDSRSAVMRCGACGGGEVIGEAHCDVRRLCVECRGRFGRLMRFRFRQARKDAVARHRFLCRPGVPGGAWREKLLTLTMPHGSDVAADLDHLGRAWGAFRRLLVDHLRVDRGVRHAPVFVRVFEVTPGGSGTGHAHIHVYMLGPFVHHVALRVLWARALGARHPVPSRPRAEVLAEVDHPRERARLDAFLVSRRGPNGRPFAEIPWPVIDVRAVDHRVEHELIKYLVKDLERDPSGELRPVSPDLFARVYVGLEGKRTVQASRGFWRRTTCERASCPHCGVVGSLRRVVRDPSCADGPSAAPAAAPVPAPATPPTSTPEPMRAPTNARARGAS